MAIMVPVIFLVQIVLTLEIAGEFDFHSLDQRREAVANAQG